MSENPQILPVQSSTERNLYNTSFSSIFFRNFVAGLGHAMGSIFLYLALIYIVGSIFTRFVLPELRPLLSTFENLGQMQTQLNPQGQIHLIPEQTNQTPSP